MLTAGVAAAVVLAGCTSTATGNPEPAPGNEITDTGSPPKSSDSTPSSEDNTYGAPRVDNPLDAGRFLADPCALLTPEQLATFGVSKPGKQDTGIEGDRACDWHADTVTSLIDIGWLAGNENGLSDSYRGRDRFAYFEETTVDGYPAVFSNIGDARADGSCRLVVGITDTLTFTVGETGRLDAQGACDRAKQIASAAIATIKRG